MRCSKTIGLMLISLVLVFSSGAATYAGEKPNVVICMTDDQGYGDVGYMGHEILQTPVLDEMAAKGLRFDRFYSAAPVCTPTRASMMTGRHPNRMGAFKWGYSLRPEEFTIAELMNQAGYATAHFGKWHLGPMAAGAPNSPGEAGFDTWASSPNFYDNNPIFSFNGRAKQLDGESSMVTVEAAVDFLREEVQQEKPFLAVVWFGNPHTPHQATPELSKLYEDQGKKKANYYGEITGIDRAMGRLRRELRDLDVAENTLLWFTSDNGPRAPGETADLRGWKGQLWEGGVRVPCLMEWPAKIPRPRRTDFLGNTSDVLPTLAEIVGMDPAELPHPIDGVSLLPVIEGEEVAREKPMGFWDYPAKGNGTPAHQMMEKMLEIQQSGESYAPQYGAPNDRAAEQLLEQADNPPGWAAWRDGDWKLHRRPNQQGVEYELYHLKTDPRESNDLAEKETERLESMKAALEAWQNEVMESVSGEDYRD